MRVGQGDRRGSAASGGGRLAGHGCGLGTAAGWDPEVGDRKGGERQAEGKGTMDENENTVVCRMNLVGCQQHKLGARGSTPRGIINVKTGCSNRKNDECRMYDRKKNELVDCWIRQLAW